MSIEIKKGMPIPKVARHGKGRPAKYPWLEMEVGDSFDTGSSDIRRHFPSLGMKMAESHGMKRRYAQRKVGDTIYVWRIE